MRPVFLALVLSTTLLPDLSSATFVGPTHAPCGFDSVEPLPTLTIIVRIPDAVPCGCPASSSPGVQSTVVFCNGGATTCFKIHHLEQPQLTHGRCNDVTGVECEDADSKCSLLFGCDVFYEDDCCCGIGVQLVVTYDNGIWGPTQDTMNVGDELYYVPSGSANCNSEPNGKKTTVQIEVECSNNVAFARVDLTCGECKKL